MKGILRLLLMTLAGGIGWWAGDFIGIFTAMLLSSLGSGVGLWVALRIERETGM